jgi:hypothetical protein
MLTIGSKASRVTLTIRPVYPWATTLTMSVSDLCRD